MTPPAIVTNAAYDFKGNLLNSTRELLTDYKDQVDWSLNPAADAHRRNLHRQLNVRRA